MNEQIRVFDLRRILLGDHSWTYTLEIVFRTALLYLFALMLLRLLGKRGKTQLTEFAVIFSLGAAIGDPMMFADVPVLHGMVVITVIVFLQRGLVHLSERNERFEIFVQGRTTRVVLNARMDLETMRGEGLSREELFTALRESGVEQLGQVKRAFLETTGSISVFKFPRHEARAGLSLLPPTDDHYQRPLPQGSPSPQEGRYACWACGNPETFAMGVPLPICPHCHGDEGWVAAEGGSD
jgi:uncharacterized membrane protein YcaP (DUF421 family)